MMATLLDSDLVIVSCNIIIIIVMRIYINKITNNKEYRELSLRIAGSQWDDRRALLVIDSELSFSFVPLHL